jgi:hypothetical protein
MEGETGKEENGVKSDQPIFVLVDLASRGVDHAQLGHQRGADVV